MSIPIVTQVLVLEKWENEYEGKEGNKRTYYNAKVADKVSYDNQEIAISKEVYDKIEKGKEYKLKGIAGGSYQKKFFRFDEVL